MKSIKIVGAMNVKNEEWIIEYSLTALSQIVDEIVIVDDGSIDKTVDIIKKFDKVTDLYLKPINGLRTEIADWNRLTRMAQKRGADWILYIDADEVFEPKMKVKIRELVKREDAGEYRFRKITLWHGLKYYRSDRPEEYSPFGDKLLNPILVKNYHSLKWVDKPLWKKILRFFFYGEKFYPFVPQYGRYGIKGQIGKKIYVDDIIALHFNAVDFSRYIKEKFEYFYWEIKSKPRRSCPEMIQWIMKKIDETNLYLSPVKKEWLWGFEHLIKLPPGVKLDENNIYFLS